MRTRLFGLALAASTLPLLSSDVLAACNIRGEFCGRPGWAANAFSHPFDRVSADALENPTTRSVYRPNSYRNKMHRRHKRR